MVSKSFFRKCVFLSKNKSVLKIKRSKGIVEMGIDLTQKEI